MGCSWRLDAHAKCAPPRWLLSAHWLVSWRRWRLWCSIATSNSWQGRWRSDGVWCGLSLFSCTTIEAVIPDASGRTLTAERHRRSLKPWHNYPWPSLSLCFLSPPINRWEWMKWCCFKSNQRSDWLCGKELVGPEPHECSTNSKVINMC